MRPPLVLPEFREWTASDGYALRGRWWPARAATPLAVLYLHGIQSHGGWYEWSASRIADAGWPVLMADRRGSGLNDAARGDAPSIERWLDDLDDLAAWIETTCAARRVALVGVSWGGKLAVAYALRRPARVAAQLLIAPGLFPQVGVGFAERVRIGASLLAGGQRRHAIPLDDSALFTENPAAQAFIAADDRKLTTATARFLLHSARLDRRLARTTAGALRAPTTLLLAEHDRIIRNAATSRWLVRIAYAPPHICTLAGAAHTLEFESDPQPFARELESWLAQLPRFLAENTPPTAKM